ncbi:hypothetical protein AB205_0116110 [Aquarana catesbeiana]|uniref:Uncharacterized protein n=1 Tax=Aquarana catesbeiana TaxID=8400 RepID=A0A2G9RKD7_AQUCT|nr:hypothetical protein AB205_0116110 [Aquarana catesbeiana]
MAFLGERPQEQWVTELDRLVQQEIELDNHYRTLQWHTEEGYLGETTECSPEGYDFGGPGLLWESLTDHFMFGDEGEPDLEDLREYRDAMLGLAGVSELKPDLDHLLRREQHLERAYRKLLEHVQQHARESAVENLKIADPNPEVLTTGQSSANLYPALITSSRFHGQEMVNLYPQTPVIEVGDLIDFSAEEEQPDEPPAEELVLGPNFTVLCPAPTAVSVELPQTSPAEDLVTEQRVQDLCPTPVAVSEAQGEKVAITSQQQIQAEKGEELARVEEAAFPPQQRSVHQGDSTIHMSSKQPDEGMEKEAAGSPPQWQLHKGLATGPRTAGLCPQLTEDEFPVKVDGTSVSTCIPQGCWAVGPDPQQHDRVSPVTLSSLHRQKGLQGEGPVQASP